MEADNELECCGCGCNNCVLDVHRKKVSITDSNAEDIFHSFDYQKFKVTNIQKHTWNSYELTFKYFMEDIVDPSERYSIDIPPSHYLAMRAPVENNVDSNITFREFSEKNIGVTHATVDKKKNDSKTDGDYISRFYTPIMIRGCEFSVIMKLELGGQMSKYICGLAIGSETEWKGVYGKFNLNELGHTKLLCFTQGIGLAPIYRISRCITEDEDSEIIIRLVACFTDLNNIPLRNELSMLQNYWNFHCVCYLSKEQCECDQVPCLCLKNKIRYNESIHSCRLTESCVNELVNKYGQDSTILICGREPFIHFIETILKKCRIKSEDIFIF